MAVERALETSTSLALSWSGGKDSALALHAVRDQGMEPDALITTITDGYERISMHGVRRELLALQATSLGIRMWNTAQLIEETKRFSRLYRGRMELIDHIFVSHFLVTGTRTVEVTTVTAPQGMPSIEDDPNARIGKPGSDHAAVVATFDF